MSIRKVSIREARQHLRQLLDQVQAGDEVALLRRGSEVGRLVRAERRASSLPDLRAFRASIKISGRPLSAAVTRARRSSRY
jgi:prevent-host-death family protein